MSTFFDVMLVLFTIFGFIASVTLLSLAVIAIIFDLRRKEVKRDEAKKADQASDGTSDE